MGSGESMGHWRRHSISKGTHYIKVELYRLEKPDRNEYISHIQEMCGSEFWKAPNTSSVAKVVAESMEAGLHQHTCSKLGLGSLGSLGTNYLGVILISPLQCFPKQFGTPLHTQRPPHFPFQLPRNTQIHSPSQSTGHPFLKLREKGHGDSLR